MSRHKRKSMHLLIIFIFACTNSCEPDPGPYTGVELPEILTGKTNVEILLLGDTGTGGSGQQSVANSIISYSSGTAPDFALLLGDNFYPDGVSSVTDPLWDSRFRYMYPAAQLQFDFYVILGNHDYEGNALAEYSYSEPVADRWKCMDPGSVLPVRLSDNTRLEIFLLDSERLKDGKKGHRLAEWAKNRMHSSIADYKILAVHRPMFSSGSHGDTTLMKILFLEEFENGTLDMAISGHDHVLELQKKSLDTDSAEELFIVSGTGAMIKSFSSSSDTLFVDDTLGFAILDLDASGPEIRFYGLSASLLYSWP